MWRVYVPMPQEKRLSRFPHPDRIRLRMILSHQMRTDPFAGDVKLLASGYYRRRSGNYRILYTVNPDAKFIHIRSIERRGSNTY